MPILQDISTPAAVDLTISTSGTAVTASFSPPANSMVVIVVNIGYLSNTPTGPTVTCADSNAVAYTAGPAAYDGQYAGAYQFFHYYSTAPGAITVTVTRTVALGQSQFEVVPYVLTGTNSSQAGQGTANGTSGASPFSKSITTTQTGSWTCVGLSVGNSESGTPGSIGGVTVDHFHNDATDIVAAAAGHVITGTPGATTLGFTWSSSSDFAWTALEILPAAGGASAISVADVAGIRDSLAVTVAVPLADSAGSVDTVTTGSPALSPSLPEWVGVEEDLSVAVSQANVAADRIGIADNLTVTIGGAPTPTPGVVIRPASPAFIKSQMPRMHIQNLITGQWINRDVQGVVSPSVTWALNTADSFTCQLAPPRGELMDASGNALVMEWRDAIYLEEYDQIKFGGIVTQSTMSGPSWSITAMGFAGYPNGMPYEGANYSRTKIDALDVVRYLWDYLQAQPGGNIGMELGTQKSGTLLGAQTETGVYSEVARKANTGDTSIWIGNAQAFNDREQITISGIPYTISHVPRVNGIATGQMTLTTKLTEPHAIHDPVAQVTPLNSPLAKAAAAGANNIQVGTTAPFASGENIMIGSDLYTINVIGVDAKGFITGNMTLTSNLKRAYAKGTMVSQVRTITPFQLFWYNSTDIGAEITSIQQEAVFDFRERHFWSDPASRNAVRHQLVFGVPRLGTRLTGLRFAEGENIVQSVQLTRDGTRYASNVIGLGAGSGAAQIRVTTSSASTGRLRRTFIFTDQTANTVARVSAKATKVLNSMSNIDTVSQIVVKNHPNAPFGSFSPGDDIPVMMASGWRNTVIWSRIVSMTQDPTTDLMTLSLARSDSYTYIAESGQAGTL
jgi:hypothetical protein